MSLDKHLVRITSLYIIISTVIARFLMDQNSFYMFVFVNSTATIWLSTEYVLHKYGPDLSYAFNWLRSLRKEQQTPRPIPQPSSPLPKLEFQGK